MSVDSVARKATQRSIEAPNTRSTSFRRPGWRSRWTTTRSTGSSKRSSRRLGPTRSGTGRCGWYPPNRSSASEREKRALTLSSLKEPRATTLADGAQVARQRAIDIDRALSALLQESLGEGRLGDLALVAVGGYGRGELSPHSDIDLLILLPNKTDVTSATLRGLLYPLWDAGWQVGHATRTPKEAIERAGEDLDAATAILSARLIGGSHDLFDEFRDRRARWIKKEARPLTRRIADATHERHQRSERAGWVLAPDLKDDVGALRDLHRLVWLRELVADSPDLPEG